VGRVAARHRILVDRDRQAATTATNSVEADDFAIAKRHDGACRLLDLDPIAPTHVLHREHQHAVVTQINEALCDRPLLDPVLLPRPRDPRPNLI
jgi:hypothetical protein